MIKRIFKSIVIFLVLLCPTAANGSDISSASYRVPLEVEELGKAYQFTLPEGAYEKIAREDFLDVTSHLIVLFAHNAFFQNLGIRT